MVQLRRIESEIRALGVPTMPRAIALPDCRQWLASRLLEVRGLLRAEVGRAKAVLSAALGANGIQILPEVAGYRVKMAWELLSASLAGGGGQNRTAYAGLFRAALYR